MTREEDELDPFAAFTKDAAAGAQLRANLARVAEQNSGTAAAHIAQEVLAGRRPIRDLSTGPEFAGLLEEGINGYRRYLNSLTPDERALLVQQAEHDAMPDH